VGQFRPKFDIEGVIHHQPLCTDR